MKTSVRVPITYIRNSGMAAHTSNPRAGEDWGSRDRQNIAAH